MKKIYALTKLLIVIAFVSSTTPVKASAILVTISSSANCVCNGVCNGAAYTNVTGNVGAVTYSWSNGATTANVTGLCAGNYTVTATDQSDMTQSSASVTITEPSVVSYITSSVDVHCNGGSDGSLTMSGIGGTAPYTYSWLADASTASTHSGLSAGTYFCNIMDANGCASLANGSVTEPAVLTSSTSSTNVSCNGGTDGVLMAFAAGGSGPYTYSWLGSGSTAQTYSNLTAGNYYCNIADTNGCTTMASATLTEPTPLGFTTSYANIACFGDSSGSVTANISGGTSPYTYSWQYDGSTSQTISNLPEGTYNCDVTDANGCLLSLSKTITQPSVPLTVDAGSDFAICYGQLASLNATASGGIAGYSYSWSSTATVTPYNSASASTMPDSTATFNLFVTDGNGCVVSDQLIITVNYQPIADAGMDMIICEGSSTTIGTSPSGGNSYYWTPSSSISDNTLSNPTVAPLTSETFMLTVTSAGGCSSTDNVLVTVNPSPTVTLYPVNVSCNGGNDGIVTTNTTGGTSPYSYLWSNAQNSSNITGLGAGNYSVTVTDVAGCMNSASATVNEPSPLIATASSYGIYCNGASTGSLNSFASGGNPPYNYSWNTGQLTDSLYGVAAGNYTVMVTDANGCSVPSSTTLTEPSALSATTNFTGTSCNGLCDGSATITASGGTSPYSFMWSDPLSQTSATAGGLCAGNFSVTITDANGCPFVDSITISEPPVLTISTVTSNISCFGLNDGTCVITATGGTPGYTYLTTPGNYTTSSLSNLSPGNYNLNVTDINGCTATFSINIVEPSALSATFSSNAESCNQANGALNTTITGGTSPFTFLWNNGATTQNINGLIAGSYSVTISDANSCTSMSTLTVVRDGIVTLNGLVQMQGNPVVSGQVTLYEVIDTTAYLPIAVSPIDGSGNYFFPELLPAKKYIIAAQPDTAVNPTAVVTYNDNTHRWNLASQIIPVCYQSQTINIDLIVLNPPAGNGTITGQIIDASDSSNHRRPGEPVIGVDVSVEQIPGGSQVMRTTTDSNGVYKFVSVPDGDYQIFVSVPGCNMISTYDVTISGADSISEQLFYVDSVHATIDTLTSLPEILCNYTPVISAATACLGQATSFSDLSDNINPVKMGYRWDFETDGVVNDTTKGDNNFIYSTSGLHLATLIIETYDGICKDTTQIQVQVNDNPVVNLTLSYDTLCLDGGLITLSGESPSGGIYSGPGVVGNDYDPTITGIGSDTVYYSYTDNNGCSAVAYDVFVIDACLGLSENSYKQMSIELFPNPANETFSIRAENITEDFSIEIKDLKGANVYYSSSVAALNRTVSIKDLSPAVYSVRFTGKDFTAIQKLVVK